MREETSRRDRRFLATDVEVPVRAAVSQARDWLQIKAFFPIIPVTCISRSEGMEMPLPRAMSTSALMQ